MSTLRQDLRYTLRRLRMGPGFAAMAIATIALAIGANTAMFSFVDGVLLNPLPYPDPDRVVRVLERRPDGGTNGISTLNFLDWKHDSTVFEYLAAQTGWGATLTGLDEPVQLRGARVSPSLLEINGAKVLLGRKFLPDEDEVGKDHVVVLSYALWQSRFGADPSIVGRAITLDGEPYTVVGVLDKGGMFDRSPQQIIKPLAFQPENMTRDFHWFAAIGKLKAGVTLEQARAEMDVIGRRISDEYPDSNKGWGVAVDRLADQIGGQGLRTPVIALFVATAFVLLIGCANLANIALARGIARRREISVRAALGARRSHLMRQFLTETVVLSLCGGVAGIGVGYLMLRWIKSLLPPFTLPAEVDVRMDTTVLLFALAVSVGTGLLFGLAPALQAARTNLVDTIKDGGAGATPSSPGRRLRGGLVVAEIALAFVLLVGSGLMLRTLMSMLSVDPGFDSTNVLTAALPISNTQHPDPVELNAYLDSIRAAVGGVAGVRETALTSALPLQGWGYGMPYQIANRDLVDRARRGGGFFKMVTPSYFQTLRINVLKGRGLSEQDTAGAPKVAVINETLAKKEFQNEDPIGQKILVQQIVPGQTALGAEIGWEIVGVIADEKINGLRDETSGGLYVTMEQSPVYFASLVVRAAIEPRSLETAVRGAVAGVNADQALSNVRTLEQITDESLVANRVQSLLIGIFAGVALLLAAIGIYGVIAYAVTQRTHELGIRAALGASGTSLRALVFRDGMRLVLVGLALGLVGSIALGRLVSSMLYGVSARDPLTLAVVTVVLAAVAAAGCFFPARRATKVDPMIALRYE
jgi:putative ABC transport system permease protein